MTATPSFVLICPSGDGPWQIERDGQTVGYAFVLAGGGWGAGLFVGEDALSVPTKALPTRRAVLAWVRRQAGRS